MDGTEMATGDGQLASGGEGPSDHPQTTPPPHGNRIPATVFLIVTMASLFLCTLLSASVLTLLVKPTFPAAVRYSQGCASVSAVTEAIFNDTCYHDNAQLERYMNALESRYPRLSRVYDIGRSVRGEKLLVIQISKDVANRVPGKPAFKYVANMHGNEAVGRQLMLQLATYLLVNYGTDPRVTRLVDTTDIHLMPTMNPDGFAIAREGTCEGVLGRYNADDVDLNRNFPEQFSEPDDVFKPALETQAVMAWLSRQPNFVLSANIHGGALVANYPFDSSALHYPSNFYSGSPDDAMFVELAKTYASAHPTMPLGYQCDGFYHFPGGITNGAYWYELKGGMQDYNYLHSNTFEITLELSCCKYPNGSSLPSYWRANKESLLVFMEKTHTGVRGIITSASGGGPVQDVLVHVHNISHKIRSSDWGEYWRLLIPGNYVITFSAPGYETKTENVSVTSNAPVQLDVVLKPSST